MGAKQIIWLCMGVGSTLGGLVPNLWGADFLSFSSIICTAIGGMLGIWVGYKISR